MAAVEATASVVGLDVQLRIGLEPRFPRKLPYVFLSDPDELGFMPHVEQGSGFVCYQSDEGLSVSTRDPALVLEEAVARAIGVIDDGISGTNRGDIAEEMAAHWRDFSTEPAVPCYVEPSDGMRIVHVRARKGPVELVADSEDAVRALLGANAKTGWRRRGVYVPLPHGPEPITIDPRELRNAQVLGSFLEQHLDAEGQRELDELVEEGLFAFVVLGLPRIDGERTLVGIRFPSKSHGDRKKHDGWRLRFSADVGLGELIHLDRRDRVAVSERGGAHRELAARRVAIIGCGSVGGHVATALANVGVGHLTLVDPDVMRFENVFRHVLGTVHVGRTKVAGLRTELLRTTPYLAVKAVPLDAFEAVEDGELDLDKIDLAIVAIGTPTHHKLIGRACVAAHLPALHTWLEPLGLGGHALLAGTPGMPGCYDCLFTDQGDGSELLTARTDFAEAGQQFARDLTGCASAFTPYGDLDARETAQLAARLALDALLKRVSSPRIRSWKGDATAFVKAGYKVSARHVLSQVELDTREDEFACPRCLTCGEPQ